MYRTRLLQGLSVGFLLVSLVAGCTSLGAGLPPRGETPDDEAPSDETPGELVYGEADVEEIDILLMESFPIQVAVVARGNLRDGCTEIDEVTTTYDEGNKTFDVDITTVRDPEAMCTQALVPFEERVNLDVQGLPAGTYTVDVNGISDTFTFDADNEIPEE